jgi:hypothetical protein
MHIAGRRRHDQDGEPGTTCRLLPLTPSIVATEQIDAARYVAIVTERLMVTLGAK